MNILHITKSDYGGAANAVDRLHNGFINNGFQSKVLVQKSRYHKPYYIEFKPAPDSLLDIAKERVWAKVGRAEPQPKSITTDPKYQFYNKQEFELEYGIDQLRNHIPVEPDVIILHWLSDFITAHHIKELYNLYKCPIIWHLLDMAPLTGGCHYAWDCEGYLDTCGECPALYSTIPKDLSYRNLRNRINHLSEVPITFIPTTHALKQQALKASISKGKVGPQIMLGVDPDIYRPISKQHPRAILDIPQDKKVLFFGAEMPQFKRKGISFLYEALEVLQDNGFENNLYLITAGSPEAIEGVKLPFPHKHFDYLQDDRSLAILYQAADLFVCPSVEDSGPMMINESIMSGTPVVSFEMGVAPDLVVQGETGFTAKIADSADFAKQIEQFLVSEKSTHEWQHACRSHALKHYHPDVQVQAFEELIADLNSGSV